METPQYVIEAWNAMHQNFNEQTMGAWEEACPASESRKYEVKMSRACNFFDDELEQMEMFPELAKCPHCSGTGEVHNGTDYMACACGQEKPNDAA